MWIVGLLCRCGLLLRLGSAREFRGVEFWKEDGDYYWTWKKNTIEHVLAWMPLPEPYAERRQQ